MTRPAPIRVGLVGAGYIARVAHLPVFSRLSDARVVALCDREVERARALARRFGVPRVCASLEEMLGQENLDLLDICVPQHHHRELITRALEADVPCLVEKPLTVTTAEADAVVALAQEKGLSVHVIHNMSALPAVLRAKAMVDRGVIGRLVGVDVKYVVPWERQYLDPNHWCHRLPGGYLGEVGSHLTMLVVEFLGPAREVRSVALKTSSHQVRLDELRILARCEAGLGTITCSLNCPSRLLTVDLFGTTGALHVNGDYQAVVHYRPLDSSRNALARGLGGVRDILARTVALASTSVNVLAGRYEVMNYGHRYLIQRCLRALRGQERYPVDLENAREAVRLLELALADMETPG